MSEHNNWFYRPENIPKLWQWGIAVLVLTVVVELIWPVHSHFAVADWTAFSAVYGFAACAVLVVAAKLLGFVVKRPENYYATTSTASADES